MFSFGLGKRIKAFIVRSKDQKVEKEAPRKLTDKEVAREERKVDKKERAAARTSGVDLTTLQAEQLEQRLAREKRLQY